MSYLSDIGTYQLTDRGWEFEDVELDAENEILVCQGTREEAIAEAREYLRTH